MVKISTAELEVMKVIWKKEKATSVEIIDELKNKKHVTWNFNTIRTLIKRLLVKGAIEIIKKESKTYTYRAVIKEEAYKTEVTRNLLNKLYHDSISELVVQYCDDGNLSLSEIKELSRKIDEMIMQKEKEQ